jgi:hypothetical protein
MMIEAHVAMMTVSHVAMMTIDVAAAVIDARVVMMIDARVVMMIDARVVMMIVVLDVMTMNVVRVEMMTAPILVPMRNEKAMKSNVASASVALKRVQVPRLNNRRSAGLMKGQCVARQKAQSSAAKSMAVVRVSRANRLRRPIARRRAKLPLMCNRSLLLPLVRDAQLAWRSNSQKQRSHLIVIG